MVHTWSALRRYVLQQVSQSIQARRAPIISTYRSCLCDQRFSCCTPLRSTTFGLMPRLTKKAIMSSDSCTSLGRGLAGGACCLPRALPSAEPVPTSVRKSASKQRQL